MEYTFYEVEQKLQQLSSPGIKPGLARLAKLLSLLGNPQHKIKAVHVVGTNGKGSTAAMLEAILRQSGYKTALYTSPHLASFGERLTVCGKQLSAESWMSAVERIEKLVSDKSCFPDEATTYFELTTAAAMLLTADENPDIAIFEAGLGGRLDATNILKNILLTVIVPIGMDHTEYLGNTLSQIAAEKFAVIRKKSPAIFAGGNGDIEKQFSDVCRKIGTIGDIVAVKHSVRLIKTDLNGTQFMLDNNEYITSLIGAFQADNAALAIVSANYLKDYFPNINDENIKQALLKVKWQGRMELIRKQPLFMLDGAHNSHAFKRFAENLKLLFHDKKVVLVMAMMRDKDISKSLELLRGLDLDIFCTEVPNMERSCTADELARMVSDAKLNVLGANENPCDAISLAEKTNSAVIVCGSLYLIAWIKNNMKFE